MMRFICIFCVVYVVSFLRRWSSCELLYSIDVGLCWRGWVKGRVGFGERWCGKDSGNDIRF